MKICRTITILALSTAALASSAEDWYRWRGPHADGISHEKGWSTQWPAEGPKRLWRAKVGIGFSSLVVSKGRVFTMGNTADKDTVFCFDADTGNELWKYSYDAKLDPKYYEGGPGSTPTVDGDQVFTFSKQGVVHCLDAATGVVVWSKNLMEELKLEMPTWGFSGSPYIEGDLCLLNAGSAGVALNKKNGKVIWSSGTTVSGYATPVPFDAGGLRALALFAQDSVIAVRLKDGVELWRFPWKTQYDVNAADPIFHDGKLFISSGYNHGGALLDHAKAPPKAIWENKSMRNQFNPSVLVDGHLYGIDDDSLKPSASLVCVDFKTGEKKWTEKTGFGSLMVADGKLVVLTAKGELIIAEPSPEKFKPVARAQVLGGKCWTTPVLSNGRIYCRNTAGEVICVDVSGK